MKLNKITICFLMLLFCFCANSVLGDENKTTQMERQEYEQDYKRIESYIKSLKTVQIPEQIIDTNNINVTGWRQSLKQNDMNSYERFADEIHSKWIGKNKEYLALLMKEVCKPLSNGQFGDDRQHDLARKYALLGLVEPNEISLGTEISLIGHVVTLRPQMVQGGAQKRREGVLIRMHALNRLAETIDPTWDPNDLPYINVSLPKGVIGGIAGMSPEHIKDPKLRAKYEAAIEKNRQKAEKYNEQHRARRWLKTFPKRAEQYIVRAYSKPPFDNAELKQYLDKYIAETKTKSRILEKVEENVKKQNPN